MHVSAGSLVDRIGALVRASEGALLCSNFQFNNKSGWQALAGGHLEPLVRGDSSVAATKWAG